MPKLAGKEVGEVGFGLMGVTSTRIMNGSELY